MSSSNSRSRRRPRRKRERNRPQYSLFPKPHPDVEEKDLNEWRRLKQSLLARDGRCMNKLCPQHTKSSGPLEPHHIHYRRHGGPDKLENLISLCPRCHLRVHGIRSHGDQDKELTGDQVMLKILTAWLFTNEWRWDYGMGYVKKRVERSLGEQEPSKEEE